MLLLLLYHLAIVLLNWSIFSRIPWQLRSIHVSLTWCLTPFDHIAQKLVQNWKQDKPTFISATMLELLLLSLLSCSCSSSTCTNHFQRHFNRVWNDSPWMSEGTCTPAWPSPSPPRTFDEVSPTQLSACHKILISKRMFD